MTYEELLNTDEWKSKRKEILARDKNKCQRCLNEKYLINLHKGYYSSRSSPPKQDSRYGYGIDISHPIDTCVFGWVEAHAFNYNKVHIVYYKKESLNYVIALRQINAPSIDKPSVTLEDWENSINQMKNYINKMNIAMLPEIKRKEDWESIEWSYIKGLNIHHKCYRVGLLPWEYKDDELITYCFECHEGVHKNERIPVYEENSKIIKTYFTNCIRCNGVGWLPYYNHVENGICFRCKGAKYEELI